MNIPSFISIIRWSYLHNLSGLVLLHAIADVVELSESRGNLINRESDQIQGFSLPDLVEFVKNLVTKSLNLVSFSPDLVEFVRNLVTKSLNLVTTLPWYINSQRV